MAALDAAFKGTVSRVQIMEQANNAILLGLPKSASAMAELAEAGRRLGTAVGKDAAFGFESLVVGIGRQSRLMLDNLGIIVKADSAYESYAKTLGKTAQELTDTEKRTAFFNAAMAGVRERLEKLGPDVETTADKFDRLKATFQDAIEVMGREALKPIGEATDELNDKLEEMAPILKNVGESAGVALKEVMSFVADFGRFIDDASLALRGLFDEAGKGAIEDKRRSEENIRRNREELKRIMAEKEANKKARLAEARAYREAKLAERAEAEKTAKLIQKLDEEMLEFHGFTGLKEKREFEERMADLRKKYRNNQEMMTAIDRLEQARRYSIEEENRKKRITERAKLRKKETEEKKSALEKELETNKTLNEALLAEEQKFLRRIGAMDKAQEIQRKAHFDRLRKLAGGNAEAMRIINALETAERRLTEEEKRREIEKTQKKAFVPSFVGAEELFRRAAIAGATIKPPEVPKRAPSKEEKEIADATRQTAENTAKLVEKQEQNIAVIGP